MEATIHLTKELVTEAIKRFIKAEWDVEVTSVAFAVSHGGDQRDPTYDLKGADAKVFVKKRESVPDNLKSAQFGR